MSPPKKSLCSVSKAAERREAGKLLPAMVLHALIDAGSGTLAWIALRESGASAAA